MRAIAGKILLIDDDSEAVLSLARLLKAKLPETTVEATAKIELVEGIAQSFDPDAIILDLGLIPGKGSASGMKVLSDLVRLQPNARIIVLTGEASVENGVRALERGAAHFLAKPADINHLLILLKDAFSLSALKRAYQSEAHEVRTLEALLVGSSSHIQSIRKEVLEVSSSKQTVLITGETGTGKGVCARAIHQCSNRRHLPFVRYQPSFASGDLVLSELFGHTKGAFTGANDARPGLLKRAEGGTLFLDELDEMPIEVQVGLLGVIQEGRYRSLGSDTENECNVRFVAATNRPIEESLASGKIRKDLFYRLAQRQINLIPLRARSEDISPIAQSMLTKLAERQLNSNFQLTAAALENLQAYPFPGNIRELEAIIESAALSSEARRDTCIVTEDLRIKNVTAPATVQQMVSSTSSPFARKNDASRGLQVQNHQERSAVTPTAQDGKTFHSQLSAFKKQLVSEALGKCSNNQVQAARLLGLDRSSFRRILLDINS